MDKSKIIVDKIDTFFASKASFQKRIALANLSLLISIVPLQGRGQGDGSTNSTENTKTLQYELKNGESSLGLIPLADILKLNMLEKAFTSVNTIEDILIEGFKTFSGKLNVEQKRLQLLLKHGSNYTICVDKTEHQKLNINELIK